MKIADLKPDTRNANRGTARGRQAVADSLRELGAGRSILVDRNGNVIAGNKTAAAALKSGIDADAIVVQTDGSRLVIVQRTDLDLLTDPRAKQLALADNRSSQLGIEWDADVLGEFSKELDLKPFFSTEELKELGVPGYDNPGPQCDPPPPEGRYKEQYGVIVICKGEADQQNVYEVLTGQGLECRVVVT